MGDIMEKYMKKAIAEAKKAFKKNEVPIGAVIVKNGKIISKAYNKKENSNLATSHAELLAINKACKKIKNWRLLDCTLYVTVEPCMMCFGAILESRISKVIYGTVNENYGWISNNKSNFNIEIIGNVCEKECKNIMKLFFEKKRKSLQNKLQK